nr:RNA-directed DNA polymerase, eukaryota [Tanacetum cinerariifolium]
MLLISAYAPQAITNKRALWNYFSSLITRWDGDCIVMGDFNEVRYVEERIGSVFHAQGASEFNNFIYNLGLVDVHLEGYSFTWSHPSATKMRKLDRFLITVGVVSLFPHISAICLDRHLLDHRPMLLRDAISDYGAIPFRFYHSWLQLDGFDQMVTSTWSLITLDDRNGMIRFKKKLQILKKEIHTWVADYKRRQSRRLTEIKSKLHDIDVLLDQGGVNDDILLARKDPMKRFYDFKSFEARDCIQKAKIQWAIEGDENSKFFHGIINRKRANLSIKGIMVDGEWVDDPIRVKEEFRTHFSMRFQAPATNRCRLDFWSPNRLSLEQASDLESPVTNDEIRSATNDPRFVSDYRPISMIGSLYKVVTKVLATRLSLVIWDRIFDVQTTFLPNRQIIDEPFIINELLSWCNHYKQQSMLFKVDFSKAYDSVRWDYLDDVRINILKSHLLGVSVPREIVNNAATNLGCSVMMTHFKYLGVMVGGNMSLVKAWDEVIGKLNSRLSKWKRNTLSIEGRLTLLKSVLGSTLIYTMSIYKVPKLVLHSIEVIRRKFFYGIHGEDKKITWVSWSKVLAAKEYGGLGVSSYHALNRALLFKWKDKWIGDNHLCHLFPRVYALETNKDCFVAEKLNGSVLDSFRRNARGGVEEHQLAQLCVFIDTVILSVSEDRWVWELNSDGVFHVKDIRRFLDEFFLPKVDVATRWIKYVPIKINVFAWRVWLDRLPTRRNLLGRNVSVPSLLYPNCSSSPEDISHSLFKCSLAVNVSRLIC